MSVKKACRLPFGDEKVMVPLSLAGRRNHRRRTLWILAWLLAAPALAGDSGPARLAPAGSFAADAAIVRERLVPIVVFYSRPNCSWCELARRELHALAGDPSSSRRMLIREIGIESEAAFNDFDGRATTHAAFAHARGIRLTPTLEFLDERGQRLAEPIVGTRTPDFYGALIERAIDESLAQLRARRP